jgi:hypothetical protein
LADFGLVFAAAVMKNISWKKILQIALIVVVTCAGIAGVVEKTRKCTNARIDRMLARNGVDQAQCRKSCEITLKLEDGTAIPAGAKIYAKNLEEYCAKNGFECINPQFSDDSGEIPNLLTFQYDGHYSPLGHQWLAQQLAQPLAKTLYGPAK